MKDRKSNGWSVMGTGTIATELMVAAIRAVGDRPLWVVSRRKQDATLFAQDLDIPKSTADLGEVWRDPAVKKVYVSARLSRRRHYILEAATQRKHILCDGPIAAQSRVAAQLSDACAEAGILLAINQPARASLIHQTMQRLILEGELGIVQSVVIVRGGAFHPALNRRIEDADEHGDIFIDSCLDDIDLTRFLTGSEPVTVCAVTKPKPEDPRHIIYAITMDSGVLVQSHASFSTTDVESMVMVLGDKAALIAHGTLGGRGTGTLTRRSGGRNELVPVREREPHLATMESVIQALDGQRTFLATGRDNIVALKTMEALAKSARLGRAVAVAAPEQR